MIYQASHLLLQSGGEFILSNSRIPQNFLQGILEFLSVFQGVLEFLANSRIFKFLCLAAAPIWLMVLQLRQRVLKRQASKKIFLFFIFFVGFLGNLLLKTLKQFQNSLGNSRILFSSLSSWINLAQFASFVRGTRKGASPLNTLF